MTLDWMISVDDHVLEPPNVWQDRLPARYRERGPRLVRDELGESWVYDGKRVATHGLGTMARRDDGGRKYEAMSPDPLSYDEMRESCYEPRARIQDMNGDGVLASLCFPSFPRFCGQVFLEAKEKDVALLCVRAYNDWMIDEWCGQEPGRLIPLVILPLWDARHCVAEIERCAARGVRALTFSENPARLGLPSLYDRDNYWDPVFDAAAEAGVVICTHIGSSSWVQRSSDDAPLYSPMIWGTASNAHSTLVDWMMSGKLVKFPKLRLALSEGGIGWIPYYLERIARTYTRNKYWSTKRKLVGQNADGTANKDFGKMIEDEKEVDLPFDFDPHRVFREQVFGCVIADTEEFGLGAGLTAIGVDNVMAETDFPHSDTSWPHSLSTLRKNLAHLSEEDQYKILQGNARRLYGIDTPEPAVTG